MQRVGIDIGGTKIEAVVLDNVGKVLLRERVPTERENGYDHIMNQLSFLHGKLRGCLDEDFLFGVCVPGPLNAEGDRMKHGNTQVLVGEPLRNDIKSIFGATPLLDNDANCFAQAEALLGAGKGSKVLFGIILGTGVGGGITIDGHAYRGRHRIAGEWGHSLLHPGGIPCYCGNRGCIERYLCGPALEQHFQDLTGENKRVTEIAQNPPAEWKDQFLLNFGMAISSIINILDPDIIVLGGGVSKVQFLYTESPKFVQRFCFDNEITTPIVQNTMGDSAGVFGAAYLP
ncbi:MAG: ROK family protein [Candidatus Neomarinimicrobiota bacterium]|nr:ROK family protein [Candidatus Neomarinimicrobiota bacterium]